MTKKNQHVLGLPNVTPDFGFSLAEVLVPVSDDHTPNTDRRRLKKELDMQLVAMEAFTTKALVGMEKMVKIQQYASGKFVETCVAIAQDQQQAEGTEYQPYVDEFCHRLSAVSAQQLLGSVKVGGTAIARELARSPYPPVLEPEQRTWLGRLLLG